ncbi:Nuclear localization sequence-binding protein [Fulvia fulva]|uniref:Nuclear localization sequence-binding protein n=1 Tax=Passalora fulva TaxID=5499 RepID=A0A9Q8L866_PASFU|nr:Nuclear localization sequence-binding protein [Fulvia fulva]KAK4635679.1 Nuclear localization sequence-binding protein [Fulvia fulva]KAK4637739.1 Nuclear localization sequence-binding protein [Fulvia fulva]UJO12581.1 Nuclear localization sequence-binding protein [Fulvia fulva]WPV09294.1 Nuclear localization sequence-binding protein [Fulvia fulva]WPV23290.1 Nuclear localization sequence-binding protein [Fulvia fulva]
MFALRRAAARAVFTQPTRQLSTFKPAPRISALQAQKPGSIRSFHQSWRVLAEEDQKRQEASPAEASTSGETVTTEPTPEEQQEIREESVVTPDVVGSAESAAEGAAAEAKDKAQEAVSQAQETASDAAEQTQEKAEEISSQAQESASTITEKVQDAASSAAQTVQNAASSVAETARNQFPPPDGPVQRQGQAPTPSKILYIGNLFFEVTSAQLEAEFSKFGEVVNTRVVQDDRGLSKGFGYVEFARQEHADRATELDQQVFHGRRMAVQFHVRRDNTQPRQARLRSDSRVPAPPSKTLFIGNMSYQMSDRDLNDLFREIKNVLDVRVAIDRRSGQPRGFAHADFIDIESAEKAKQYLEKKEVYGRRLRVDFSQSAQRDKNSE